MVAPASPDSPTDPPGLAISAASPPDRETRSLPHPGHAPRIWALAVTATVMVAAGVAAAFWWQSQRLPRPVPNLVLDHASPAARRVITGARLLVLKRPRSGVAWGRLGMILLAHSFEDAAGECFAAAEMVDAGNFRWPYYAGICAAVLDPEQALDHFTRAAELASESPLPKFRQAELLMDLQRLDDAERVLSSIPESGQQQRLLYDRVRLALLRDNRAALKSFSSTQLQELSTGVNRRSCRELLAQVQQRLGHPAEAQELSRQSTAQADVDEGWDDPLVGEVFALRTDPAWQAEQAQSAFAAGRTEAAVRQMEEVVADTPHDSRWALELAAMWTRLRQRARAHAVLQAAAAQHADSARIQFELGNLDFQGSDWQSAVRSYERAIRLKPDYGLAYYNLGQAQLRLRNRAAATTAFQAALRCQPDLAEAHFKLGELLAESPQPDEQAAARVHLTRAAELRAQDPRASKRDKSAPSPNGAP